jgi:hypothetical protein
MYAKCIAFQSEIKLLLSKWDSRRWLLNARFYQEISYTKEYMYKCISTLILGYNISHFTYVFKVEDTEGIPPIELRHSSSAEIHNRRIQGGARGRNTPKILHEIPQKFSRLPPLGAIFLSAPPPLTWNPGSAPGNRYKSLNLSSLPNSLWS